MSSVVLATPCVFHQHYTGDNHSYIGSGTWSVQKGPQVHDHFVHSLIERHTGCIGCVWSPPCCSALYRNPSLHSTLLPRSRSLAYPRRPNPLHSTASTSSLRPFPIPLLAHEYRPIFQVQGHSQTRTFNGPTEIGQI